MESIQNAQAAFRREWIEVFEDKADQFQQDQQDQVLTALLEMARNPSLDASKDRETRDTALLIMQATMCVMATTFLEASRATLALFDEADAYFVEKYEAWRQATPPISHKRVMKRLNKYYKSIIADLEATDMSRFQLGDKTVMELCFPQ